MSQSNRILGEAKIARLLFKFSVPCVMGLLISIVLMVICEVFAVPLMQLFGASEQTVCAVYFFKPKNFVLTRRSFLPDKVILKNHIAGHTGGEDCLLRNRRYLICGVDC